MRRQCIATVLAAGSVATALLIPSAARAGFAQPVTVTPSGGDPFGYPSGVGISRSGETTVETVSEAGDVLVYTSPAGGGSFSGGTLATGTRASMAIAANGAGVIVYKASSTSVGVAYRSGSGAPFTAGVATYPGASVGTVAAGIDSTGNAVVAWKDGAIHYALSSGGSFGPAQVAPLGTSPGFEGKGSDPQRDRGPRAFRDDAGNVVLAYRDGNAATVAHRSPSGDWDTAVLPGGDSADISADADATTGHLIVGYVTSDRFRAFVGETTTASGTVKVSEPVTSATVNAVAVRRGGSQDLALWDADGGVQSAGSQEGYAPAQVSTTNNSNGLLAAVTCGGDELALFPGDGLQRAARARGGSWVNTPYAVGNFGTFAIGAGYTGQAFALYVDFPDDTGITGFGYTSDASCSSGDDAPPPTTTDTTSTSTSTPAPPPPAPTTTRPTGTQVICTYSVLTSTDTCTATVGDAGVVGTPTGPSGSVSFSSPQGLFTLGSTCSLTRSNSSPSTSSCSVAYLPPDMYLPKIAARYSGDATHAPSTAQTQYLGANGADTYETPGPSPAGGYPNEIVISTPVAANGTTVSACAVSGSAVRSAARTRGLVPDLKPVVLDVGQLQSITDDIGRALSKISHQSGAPTAAQLGSITDAAARVLGGLSPDPAVRKEQVQMPFFKQIGEALKGVLEGTPPELQSGIQQLTNTFEQEVVGAFSADGAGGVESQQQSDLLDVINAIGKAESKVCKAATQNIRADVAVTAAAKTRKQPRTIAGTVASRTVKAGTAKLTLHLNRKRVAQLARGRKTFKLAVRVNMRLPSAVLKGGYPASVVEAVTLRRGKSKHRS